jgi:hypothetical protein
MGGRARLNTEEVPKPERAQYLVALYTWQAEKFMESVGDGMDEWMNE